MEEKNKILLKRLLIAVLIIVIISIVATIGIGNYFVNYAILRTGNGGDREVKNADSITVANIDNEAEKIIEENKKNEKQLANEWSETIENKKVEVKAKDGITLRGTQYIKDESSNKWAIILHGYRSTPNSIISIGMHFSKEGYNVLIPSMRACSESDGEYIGMGWLDKEDLQCWINLIIKQNENAEIILHGSSMGAATVLMASGKDLPTNVKAIVADSGYTQVKNNKTPILFIHGDADDFVPEYMCEELYEAANCKKDKLIIHDAGHTDSKYKEPETYYNKIFEFLGNI